MHRQCWLLAVLKPVTFLHTQIVICILLVFIAHNSLYHWKRFKPKFNFPRNDIFMPCYKGKLMKTLHIFENIIRSTVITNGTAEFIILKNVQYATHGLVSVEINKTRLWHKKLFYVFTIKLLYVAQILLA